MGEDEDELAARRMALASMARPSRRTPSKAPTSAPASVTIVVGGGEEEDCEPEEGEPIEE